MKNKKSIIEELIKSHIKTRTDLNGFKRLISKKYKISYLSNIQLLKAYHELLKCKRIKRNYNIEELLKTRPVRSLSGIVNVSVLTKPYPCPGKCIYCPSEKGIPKSYLSEEPAVQRAKQLKYLPSLQVKKRMEMLKNQGHPTDKIDLRIIGGTWSFYPENYRIWFTKKCFDACNGKKSGSLAKAQKINETAKNRIVGLSVETRPDFICEKEIKTMRKLGITKVELGIQSIYDDVLKTNKRGHKVEDIVKATRMLKDAGFKISYQVMPNLPGSNPGKDRKTFEQLFKNPDFKPDLLKIYPCAILKEAPLYKLQKKLNYKPYSEKTLIKIIKEAKIKIPYYVRIERITRDIPSNKILKGPAKISNLRQVIKEEMLKEKSKCNCIRCREVKEKYNQKEKTYLFRKNYPASGGKEIFLTFENKKQSKLYSLLRLRIPGLSLQKGGKKFAKGNKAPNVKKETALVMAVLRNAAIIREVHTFGQQVPISERSSAPQHKGLGKILIKEAEKISKKEFGLNKIAVISASGVRIYYKNMGYKLKDTYMIKNLSD